MAPPGVEMRTWPLELSDAAVLAVELTMTFPPVIVTSPFWPSSVSPLGFRMHRAHGPPARTDGVEVSVTVNTTFAVELAPTVRSPLPIAFAK